MNKQQLQDRERLYELAAKIAATVGTEISPNEKRSNKPAPRRLIEATEDTVWYVAGWQVAELAATVDELLFALDKQWALDEFELLARSVVSPNTPQEQAINEHDFKYPIIRNY